MKKLFALLCGILLLCAACAPVTPETPEQSADATTAATTMTAITTSYATTTTTTTTVTTAATTTTTATTITPTAPSTTAKPTTRPGYISSYPVPFTVDEYRAFLAEVAKNPEHITDTIAKNGFYKPEHFREWFVDKQAHVPLLSGKWFVTDFNQQAGREVVIEQHGVCMIMVTNGDHCFYLEHYMYDSERMHVNGGLSTEVMDGGYEITKRRMLTTKDGREAMYLEACKGKGTPIIETFLIHVDGYYWRITSNYNYISGGVNNTEAAEDLVRNLSFEKIEL